MECSRCCGFMVIDTCVNMEGDCNKPWIWEWRCINCGEIFDHRTLENRTSQLQSPSLRLKKIRRSVLPSYQLTGKAR